jgi:hypothetical protein
VNGDVRQVVNANYQIDQPNCTHGVPGDPGVDCDYLTLDFGSMGSESATTDWGTYLVGYVHLKVGHREETAGNYHADDDLKLVFLMHEHAVVDIKGATTGAKWLMEDNSIFHVSSHQPISEGIWLLSDNALVDAAYIDDGVWEISDNAKISLTADLSPASITIDGGDSVTCRSIFGFDPGEDEFEFAVILDDGASLEAFASATHQGTRDANASYV